jgi:hypothetical protein
VKVKERKKEKERARHQAKTTDMGGPEMLDLAGPPSSSNPIQPILLIKKLQKKTKKMETIPLHLFSQRRGDRPNPTFPVLSKCKN